MALAAVCLRCVCVARYRTTNESSGDRGKRKGLRGKRRGATKTNAFVAVALTLYMKIVPFLYYNDNKKNKIDNWKKNHLL